MGSPEYNNDISTKQSMSNNGYHPAGSGVNGVPTANGPSGSESHK